MPGHKVIKDKITKKDKKEEWEKGEPGEIEKKNFLEVVNHAHMLNGDDIFMLSRAISIKKQ